MVPRADRDLVWTHHTYEEYDGEAMVKRDPHTTLDETIKSLSQIDPQLRVVDEYGEAIVGYTMSNMVITYDVGDTDDAAILAEVDREWQESLARQERRNKKMPCRQCCRNICCDRDNPTDDCARDSRRAQS